MGKVVGIDLGTTNSVIAIMEGGMPTVIANKEGLRTTPSIVAYTKNKELLVGQIAKRQTVINPKNTFSSVKRFIGSSLYEVENETQNVPYDILKDSQSNVKIDCPILEKQFSPEEISAQVLKKLVDDAETYIGEKITDAVITVPAYFNDSQRQATKDAGKIAGLNVLRIINEPTAASLAYGLDKKVNETILVFDLGGGTFDVSLLEVGDGIFEVLSTAGDTNLGGNDFDNAIVSYLINSFKEKENINLREDAQALQRLTEAAEKAKIELSNLTETQINLPFITADSNGPKHIEESLNRSKFEKISEELIERCRIPVEKALRDANITTNKIDQVVLVGGSTRIPAVQQLVKKITNKDPNQTVNPDEVVAIGAAIQAGILSGEVKGILLLDVTPLSLGIETLGGVTTKLIPRNTTIPTRKSEIFSTAVDNQTNVEIRILQGERELSKDNKSLGNFLLDGIPQAPRGVPQIEVALDIDVDGILSVTARDKSSGKEQSITIQNASTLDQNEVERMVKEAEENAEIDKKKKDLIEIKNKAEALCYQAEKQLNELDKNKFDSNLLEKVSLLISELKELAKSEDFELLSNKIKSLEDSLIELSKSTSNTNVNQPQQSPSDTQSNNNDAIDVDFVDVEN